MLLVSLESCSLSANKICQCCWPYRKLGVFTKCSGGDGDDDSLQ